MDKKQFLLLLILALCTADTLLAQRTLPPKRELRGVWVASVANIDYPLKPTNDSETLKREWLKLLDGFERAGLNAVVVQIRPTADALYPSSLVPWSAYLTGQQGLAPSGDWDPLAFMIETSHARNMEFHAWLNPYRATNDLDTLKLSPEHVFHKHREWILRYGPKLYLNPALPDVWEHLITVVEDIVQRYEVDAIHMDDYFYPYKIAGEAFPDSADYAQRGGAFASIDDWRRHNVDTLIYMLHKRIKAAKPYVEFGISPFSVWRNQDKDPEGSPTRAGQTNYDDLYADIRKWLREGWIDYVVPQLYFHIGFEAVDYEKTLRWWYDNAYGAKLYIGMASYRVGADRAPQWSEPDQIPRQLRINRSLEKVHGHIFFSAKHIEANPLGLTDSLRHHFFRTPALLPLRQGAAVTASQAPVLERIKKTKNGILLEWQSPSKPMSGHWVLYRFPKGIAADIHTPEAIHKIFPVQPVTHFLFEDRQGLRGVKYQYRVTYLDQNYAESPPSNIAQSKRFPNTLKAKL